MLTDTIDLDAGYLTPQQLNEQLQYLGVLLGLQRSPGHGYSQTGGGSGLSTHGSSLPNRWRGHRDALLVRYNQFLAEMALRKLPVPGPQPLPEDAILWPVSFSQSPLEQLVAIRQSNERGVRGRIASPQSEHELWAQYKYSVLARNHEAYRHFGQLVAARGINRETLALELVSCARVVPTLGGLRNAVFHMWGYVSQHSRLNPNQTELLPLMLEIQELAQTHQVSYLLQSTALGELAYWCQYYAAQEAAAKAAKAASAQKGGRPSV